MTVIVVDSVPPPSVSAGVGTLIQPWAVDTMTCSQLPDGIDKIEEPSWVGPSSTEEKVKEVGDSVDAPNARFNGITTIAIARAPQKTPLSALIEEGFDPVRSALFRRASTCLFRPMLSPFAAAGTSVRRRERTTGARVKTMAFTYEKIRNSG